jgi:hypothetical protein
MSKRSVVLRILGFILRELLLQKEVECYFMGMIYDMYGMFMLLLLLVRGGEDTKYRT